MSGEPQNQQEIQLEELESDISQTEAEVGEFKSKLVDLEARIASEKDRALRAHAELENFKRRKEQEKESFARFANEEFAKALLPTLDSFDRALEHAPADSGEILKGFQLVHAQLLEGLAKVGVKPIEAVGKPFDPNLHQAIAQEDAENMEPQTVIKDMQRGYKLHDRVIRHSMVVVAK